MGDGEAVGEPLGLKVPLRVSVGEIDGERDGVVAWLGLLERLVACVWVPEIP